MTTPTTPTAEPRPPTEPGRARGVSPVKFGAVILVAVVGVLVGRSLVGLFAPHLYAGTVLQGDLPAPAMSDLSLARTGEAVDLAAYEDGVVIVFFGYANCPDVCPASMALAAKAVAGLDDADRERVDVMMVSVDPNRDDPDSLQRYVEFFDPGFEGVSGSVEAIDRVSSGFGVFYELEPTAATGADDYLVDHTASMFGIGPDGVLRVVWPPTVSAEELRADIEQLL